MFKALKSGNLNNGFDEAAAAAAAIRMNSGSKSGPVDAEELELEFNRPEGGCGMPGGGGGTRRPGDDEVDCEIDWLNRYLVS